MSFLCGCFSSIGHRDGRTRSIQGRAGGANRIHIDPKSGGISKAWDDFKSHAPKQKNVLILGLEGSGKTTLIHQLVDKKMLLPPPSVTIEQYRIVLNDIPMLLVDVPGSVSMNVRDELAAAGLFAVVFVIDWADELRRYLAIENLAQLFFSNDQVRKVPVLVVVNKVDPDNLPEPGCVSLSTSIHGNTATLGSSADNLTFNGPTVTPEICAGILGLSMIPHTRMRVICCSAASGWGINDIAVWLNDTCSADTSLVLSSPPSVHHDQSILW
eukprot:Phypoly_transcript_13962.p1 GENE.Phypoly_transcript_13962~~Phypoly_transcript_13962.p1  ORF type:complete len:270 (+),score=23.53 Phypoly_transcript_13962:48-857(+)